MSRTEKKRDTETDCHCRKCFPNRGLINAMKGHIASPPAFSIHQTDNPPKKPCQGCSICTHTSSLAQPSSSSSLPRSSLVINVMSAVITNCTGTSLLTRKLKRGCPSQAAVAQSPADPQLFASCWYPCLHLAGTPALCSSVTGNCSSRLLGPPGYLDNQLC